VSRPHRLIQIERGLTLQDAERLAAEARRIGEAEARGEDVDMDKTEWRRDVLRATAALQAVTDRLSVLLDLGKEFDLWEEP
jgi:hypothetical protein